MQKAVSISTTEHQTQQQSTSQLATPWEMYINTVSMLTPCKTHSLYCVPCTLLGSISGSRPYMIASTTSESCMQNNINSTWRREIERERERKRERERERESKRERGMRLNMYLPFPASDVWLTSASLRALSCWMEASSHASSWIWHRTAKSKLNSNTTKLYGQLVAQVNSQGQQQIHTQFRREGRKYHNYYLTLFIQLLLLLWST